MGAVPALLSLIFWVGVASAGDLLLLLQDQGTWETQLHDELALSMSTLQVQDAPEGFQQASLGGRLSIVRPLLEGQDGEIAVAWLDTSDPAVLRVALAFVESERAVVRVFEYPREDGVAADMALATREFLASAYFQAPPPAPPPPPVEPPAPVPPPPPVGPAVLLEGAIQGVAPLRAAAGGARVGAELGLGTPVGPGWIAVLAQAQVGASQWRAGPQLRLRYDWIWVGVQADWTTTEWTTQLQPRMGLGLQATRRGWVLGTRVLFAPVRDEVVQDGAVLYDSGRVEVGISLGMVRKNSAASRHHDQ